MNLKMPESKLTRRSFLKGVTPLIAMPVIPDLLDRGTPKNDRYSIRIVEEGTVEITCGNSQPQRFFPSFSLLYRTDDPQLTLNNLDKETNFYVPGWKAFESGDLTTDLFMAAKSVTYRASDVSTGATRIRWKFDSDGAGLLDAYIEPTSAEVAPVLTFEFRPNRPGWYSIGFTGGPEIAPADLDSIWQPFVWQERRFPKQSFLSLNYMCPLPAVLVESRGTTVGVAADPSEIPFGLPIADQCRYGVLVRNRRGNAQPQIFSPVLGHAYSRMEKGSVFTFRFRLIVSPGSLFNAYRQLARSIYAFYDYRENGSCSLNDTLDNIISLVMDDYYSGWVPDLKGFVYGDVKDTVKIVSSLHPLSVSMIRDSVEIYLRRALPMMEYMLSRQKYLFAKRPDITGQSASHYLDGPCAEVSELSALYSMSQQRSEIFRYYATEYYHKPRVLNLNMVSAAASWQDSLALYRMTGETTYIEKAIAGADTYITERIAKPATDFSDVHIPEGGQFWTDFAPKWIDLLELYEETNNRKYLDAAVAGANLYTQYVWLHPTIPSDEVVANKGGTAHTNKPKRAPEESIPAWRVSAIGLTPEASTTYRENPAVLLTHYAAYLLRLGYYTGDNFFRDIARSAVVGRYCNYPGYSIMGGSFTTIYQRPDFPLHPYTPEFPGDWTDACAGYGAFYYNHIFPQIALLLDYLISDAFVRSEGRICFPSRYAQGYAYLQSKVYGDRPGVFYGETGVRLWMPRDAIRVDNLQVNYLIGYGNGNLYIALMNQSRAAITAAVHLHPDIIPVNVNRRYRVRAWRDNRLAESLVLDGAAVRASVSPMGITGLAVEGLPITTRFQERLLANPTERLSEKSFRIIDSPFGKITAMLISMGPSLTSAYVWLEATEERLREARLEYRLRDDWQQIVCPHYPFEFTVLFGEQDSKIELRVAAVTASGKQAQSSTLELLAWMPS